MKQIKQIFLEVESLTLTHISQGTEAASGGVLQKKGVLKNFAIFTGKFLCWSLFLIKVLAQACKFIKETAKQVLSCKYCENFKNIYFAEYASYPFMHQPHKIVNDSQTIRRQITDELFEFV